MEFFLEDGQALLIQRFGFLIPALRLIHACNIIQEDIEVSMLFFDSFLKYLENSMIQLLFFLLLPLIVT